MLYLSEVEIEKAIVHQVGNKLEEGSLVLSENEITPEDELKNILKNYFFNSFKEPVYYQFISLDENPVFQHACEIFNDENNFVEKSKEIAKHLFEQTYHPKIKQGELYIVKFTKCVIDDELCNAIGIFKSENKDPFLKVQQNKTNLNVTFDIGVNVNKLDKGCLIFNTERAAGFKVCMVDISGKSKEAGYWKDDFLHLEQRKDDFYQTQNYMQMCKGFVNEVFNEKNGIERADQIDLLNKTANYFEEKEDFDLGDFEQKVIENSEVINAFKDYKDQYIQAKELEIKDQFGISSTAVKKGKAQFKSVLKLDKNFHIYIHGDRSRIVKGFDASTGLHFYQVFYEQED